jgi:hypothetical protein
LIALRSHSPCLSMLKQWHVLLSEVDLLVHLDLGHGVDPRVLNYLEVDATVDTSFPSDCSDSGCSPRSGDIFERCSDDSMSS